MLLVAAELSSPKIVDNHVPNFFAAVLRDKKGTERVLLQRLRQVFVLRWHPLAALIPGTLAGSARRRAGSGARGTWTGYNFLAITPKTHQRASQRAVNLGG